MKLIEARGSPREIGYAIGASAPDLVAHAVGLIGGIDLTGSALDERLASIEKRIRRSFPAVLEELEGVAAGARVPLRDLLVLTVSADLSGRLPAWCSTLALRGRNGPLLAKNADGPAQLGPVQVLERLAPTGRIPYLHMTTAGAVWTDGGINAAGLGLLNASLFPAASDPQGLPDGIVVRETLSSCPDVPTAVSFLSQHPFMSFGHNLLLADAEGRVVVVEKVPGRQATREGCPIAACNHALTREIASRLAPDDPVRRNSERRLARLSPALASERTWAPSELQAVLDDVTQVGRDGLWTIGALIAEPASGRLWVADGASPGRRFDIVPTWPLDGIGSLAHAAVAEKF